MDLTTALSICLNRASMSLERPTYLPELTDPWPRLPDTVPVIEPVVATFEPTLPANQPRPTEAAPPEPAQPEAPQAKERERITVAGRVGQAPTIRTTPKGTLVAKFPLGEHTDEGRTLWHTVLAFQKRAEQVRDSIHRGDAVEVIGYRHTREAPGRDGPRTIAEIYATVVKPR